MKLRLSAIALAASVIYGCGGGGDGSGGAVDGLVTPSSMNIVSASSEGAQVNGLTTDFAAAANALARGQNSAGTDYATDATHAYVWDESMEALEIVNEILCYMGQTGASEMVNQGAYTALINGDKCRQGENQSSAGSAGQSSGGTVTQYEMWTVNSTRADNQSPQFVNIWVPEEGGDGDSDDPTDSQTILVDMRIDEGVSDARPFGSFTLNFRGVFDASEVGGSSEEVTMQGMLRTVDNADGDLQFEFINLGGSAANPNLEDFSFVEKTNVIMDDAAGTGGRALAHRSVEEELFSASSTYAINFDAGHVLRGKDDNDDQAIDAQQCLSRTDFDTQVWRYNLYHKVDGTFAGSPVTAGERVQLNSGFPFKYNGRHGHMSYWGMWYDGDTQIPDGATIQKFDYATDESTPMTVNVAPGKLIRRQANTENLASLQGDEFMFWGEHATLGFGEYVVSVDNSNAFVITHSFQWGENGPETTDIVDDDITPGVDGDNLWFWSDALGGNIVYVHETAVAANDRQVTFYGESFVNPDDDLFNGGNVTLYCYDRCLQGGLTQNAVDAAVGANGVDDLYYPGGAERTYTAEVSNGKLLLRDDTNGEIVSADGLSLEALGHEWGINTGEMATAALAGDWWAIYNQDVSYRWETGSNDWNHMVTAMYPDNSFASFDRPLSMSYTHSTANDRNDDASFNGKKFLLQYGGPGELWGFPWVEDGERWYSAVTLNDGVTLSDGSNDFLVKAIEMEQTMLEDVDGCVGLDIAGLFADAELTLPTADDIGTVDFGLSDKPSVSDAPAVIEGEVQ